MLSLQARTVASITLRATMGRLAGPWCSPSRR